MQKDVLSVFLFLLLLTEAIYSKITKFQRSQLNDYVILQKFEEISHLFNDQVEEIQIIECIISNQGYEKLFSLNLTNLKTIKINHNHINKYILKTIFHLPYLNQIKHLELIDCNIDDNMLQFAIQERNVSIQKLDLSLNLISKVGWTSLSKLKFISGLKEIKLDGNSFYYEDSIDSILSMNVHSLINISLSHTLISPASFFRIMNSINSNQIVSLNISDNVFPDEFFLNISQIRLPNLKVLDLSLLNLDLDIIKYLTKWKLQNLEVLMVEDNFLDDLCIKQWITKQNFPKLSHLNISVNRVGKEGIKHFAESKFTFKSLMIRKNKLANQDILQLLLLNGLNHLQALSLSDNLIDTQSLRKFLEKAPLESLKAFNLMELPYVSGLFEFFPYQKLQNLISLKIKGPDITKGFQNLLKMSFPSLKVFHLSQTQISPKNFLILLKKVKEIMPQIEQIILSINPQLLYLNISQLKNIGLPANCKVMTDFLVFKSTPKGLSLFSINMEKYLSLSCIQKDKSCQQNFGKILLQLFNFDELNDIDMDTKRSLKAWTYIISKLKRLPKLKIVEFEEIKVSTDQFFKAFVKLEPYSIQGVLFVNNLWLRKPNSEYQYNDTYLITNNTIQLLKLPIFKNLNYIFFYNVSANISKLFNEAQFPLLTILALSRTQIRSKDLKQILNGKIKNSPISSFYLTDSMIYQDVIETLTNFPHTIVKLYLNNFPLKDQIFSRLSDLNTQFLKDFNFEGSSVTDKGIELFVKLKKDKNLPVFPMINRLFIGNNYISSSGLKLILSNRMPYLTQVIQTFAQNPSFISDVLNSQSRRIKDIIFTNNDIDLISNTINPKAMRRLQRLIFKTLSLKTEDFRALSQFQFFRLQTLLLEIQIRNCEDLKSLLKIAQNAKILKVYSLYDQLPLYDGSCFSNFNVSLLRMKTIGIQLRGQHYIPKFTELLLTPKQHLSQLSLNNFHGGDELLLKLINFNTFQKLSKLFLRNWDISDVSVIHLFNLELNSLEILSLRHNQHITSKSLQPLTNKTIQMLKTLVFGQTSIGTQGVKILVSIKFEALQVLDLCNIGMNKEGLMMLSNLTARKLKQLDISMNNFTQQDLKNFRFDKFKELKKLSVFIKGGISSKLYDEILQKGKKNVQKFQLNAEKYHLPSFNYANIDQIQ